MSFVFTPLATDSFTPNANPLNPAKWTTFTDNWGNLQAASGFCEGTDTGTPYGGFNGAYYSGVVIPPDQYVTADVTFNVGSLAGCALWVRATTTGDSGYLLIVGDNGDGTVGISINRQDNNVGTVLYTTTRSYNAGDAYTFAAKGSTLCAYQNGVLITSLVDTTYPTGKVALEADINSVTDVKFSNFVAGSVALGGPVTIGTVFPGQYFGSSLATAFPNVQGLDVFQVVNEGGKIVWNLSKSGVASVNPTSPTSGTLLGQFEGSSFATAFPNPYQLNVFQVVGRGGGVVFHVDYQGNAVTP